MTNRNYTKYSEKSNEETEVVTTQESEVETEPESWAVTVEDDGVHVRPVVDGEIVETPEEPEVELEVDNVIEGYITNCKKVYIREEPSKDAEPVCIAEENTEVAIFIDESTEVFYKIAARIDGSLVSGYCVKDFIRIH